MPANYSDIGRALREAREARGLKQKDVAEHLGMTDANVSRIEAGAKTPIENIEAYARMVGADVDLIFVKPGDRRGALALRLARAIPLLDAEADETILDTLEAWCRKWELKHGAALRTPQDRG